MTARTFGRKGGPGAPGQQRTALIAHQPRSFQPIARQSRDDDDIAARRAAFLAEERARPRPPGRDEEGIVRAAPAHPRLTREKGLGTAYALWFFLGGLSLHRFYLGFATSGVIQVALVTVAYALIFAKSPVGLVLLLGWALWLFADAFLILVMHRKANERIRGGAVASVFA